MKKHFKYLSMAAMAASMFAACSDVPELPYPFPGDDNDTTEVGGVKTLPYVDLVNSQGNFTIQDIDIDGLNFVWTYSASYGCMKGTGYYNTNHAVESWLVSPVINLTNETSAYLNFNHSTGYLYGSAPNTHMKVKVAENYVDDVQTATWTELTVNNWYTGTSFEFVASGNVDISGYAGKQIVIAFQYQSTEEVAPTWEIKDFSITATPKENNEPSEPETPDTPGADIPDGESLLTNCSFENWTGGKPTGWAGVSSNATISQSTDAHQGVYSVLVEGATTNKRFTSGTVTLKAGTYGISAYLKQTGDAAGKYRLGYVKLTNGAVANTSTDYIYITEPASVGSEWEQATCAFELTEDTELAIIIMNSKNGNGNAILVDDVTLTTEDGGLTEGGNEEEPETPGDETYSGKYIKVTEFTGAGTYLLVNGDQAFTQLDATKTYGYMPAATVSISNGEIAASAATEAAKLTIAATDGGYTLQDASARYIYMKGTYNSFNIGTTAEESYVWTITANGDDTFSVTNADMGKTIMYDTQYSNFGCYPDKTDARLYVNIFKYIAE